MMTAVSFCVFAFLVAPDLVSCANDWEYAETEADGGSACQGASGMLSFAFGEGVDIWGSGWPSSTAHHHSVSSPVWWATKIDGVGLALCTDQGVQIRNLAAGTSLDVSLAPLSTPVGATAFAGRLYVACFGSWPTPSGGDSGVAVIDIASGRLLNTYPFSASGDVEDSVSHVHNVYLFEWDGGAELFVAVLGNPWITPPVPGKGLVRFDHLSGAFCEVTSERLSVRSAVQQPDGTFFVLTQEPPGVATKLASLRRRGGRLEVAAVATLPEHASEDGDLGGGADVVLGQQPNTVWCTDRNAGSLPGKLYNFEYRTANQSNDAHFTQVAAYDTGTNPRYMTMLTTAGNDGAIVVCNQNDASLSVFPGLALHPTEAVVPSELPTVDNVAFFLQGRTSSLCMDQDNSGKGISARNLVQEEGRNQWSRSFIKLSVAVLMSAVGASVGNFCLTQCRVVEEGGKFTERDWDEEGYQTKS